MYLFLSVFGIFISQIYTDSNFNPDYPNVTFCVIPDAHPHIESAYIYLKRQLGLDRGCTHIRGSLYIDSIHRDNNGTDPDMSFLEKIVEISGVLKIVSNSVKSIPLGNLKIIRGISSHSNGNALQISHNLMEGSHYLENLDLHSLRVIMNKNVQINDNYGLDYLVNMVDWSQILRDTTKQKIMIKPSSEKNLTYQCHPSCEPWKISSNNSTQFCFGPEEQDCQERSKCITNKGYTWCQFIKGTETVCDRQCVGGCLGHLPQQCQACKGVYKKDQCVSTCASETNTLFGAHDPTVMEDKLIYTTGGLCTSRCPDSLLDQDKVCIYQCDFSKYYKSGNRCLECPNQNCFSQIGDELMCDLKTLDPKYPTFGRRYFLNSGILPKLKNCTLILGHFTLNDDSFLSKGVTVQMLYDNLKNVRTIIGDFSIHLNNIEMKNLTFLSNLREFRGTTSLTSPAPGFSIFIRSLEFFGLKKLEKIYGILNFNEKSKLCYENTIPWHEITQDDISESKCDKKCHPLCTRGCWGPGNEMCYKCAFMVAGEHCVKACEDAPGYYTHNSWSSNQTECRKCHPMCKGNCTGPLSSDCNQCRFAKESGSCVKSCSPASYSQKLIGNEYTDCMPCSKTCYFGENLKSHNFTSACSGPSNEVGLGGCSMCNKVIEKGNKILCHIGTCPRGFFESKIKESISMFSVQQISCTECHPLCSECSSNGTNRESCLKCRKFWNQDNCEPVCLKNVFNVSRILKPGDDCPRCHPECRDSCQIENDNSKCTQCVHKKLFHDVYFKEFSCVTHCPVERNYSDYIGGDFVCLTYEETIYYQQKKRITFVALTSLAILTLAVIIIVLLFRWKFRQSKIKTELKAFYSNFNEPNMKNLKEDHIARPPNMNRLQMIPISDLIFDINAKPLGAGAFGKVFRGYWKVPGPDGKSYQLDVVVKVIHNSSKSSTNEFLEEAQIMASVSHRHCLPLIGVCFSLEKPCLVSTFAEYGSLEKYLHQNSTKISSYSLIKWSEQIADGMAYLNMRGIIHRDLATRNILVTHKNIVQITDFGLARLVDDTEDGIVVQSGRVPVRWLALETLLYANYSTASDIWAYGVTLWEIFTFGKRPYEEINTSKVKAYLLEGNRLYQPDICTLEIYMIMIKCWLEDSQMRPSFTELTSTFEQFSHNSKRYLCIPREHFNEYSYDTNKEAICLNQLSMDSECKVPLHFNNQSDDNSWNQTRQNDSAYHLINPYSKDESDGNAVLPRRKKTKRNISLKSLQKINITKLLSKSRDSKSYQYQPSNSYDSNKIILDTCMSYESTTALINHQRSCENDGQPINPQIAKLLKQENWQPPRVSKNLKKQNSTLQSERIFNDKNIMEEAKRTSLEKMVGNRSPSLPPIGVCRFVSMEPPIEETLTNVETKPATHSPDSGNSQDFDIDDYLIPSRVQSTGYYNLTPSPSSNTKPQMDLVEPFAAVHNENYDNDDGYLEPTSKLIH